MLKIGLDQAFLSSHAVIIFMNFPKPENTDL